MKYHLPQRVKVKVKKLLSCVRLCANMANTVKGILQARMVEWVAFPFSRESSQPGITHTHTHTHTHTRMTGSLFFLFKKCGRFIHHDGPFCSFPPPWLVIEAANSAGRIYPVVWLFLVSEMWPTHCPMDCSLPGSFVRGILQAKILDWVAISSSREWCPFPHREWFSLILLCLSWTFSLQETEALCPLYIFEESSCGLALLTVFQWHSKVSVKSPKHNTIW